MRCVKHWKLECEGPMPPECIIREAENHLCGSFEYHVFCPRCEKTYTHCFHDDMDLKPNFCANCGKKLIDT